MNSWQNCSNCLMLSCQYEPKSPRNVSSTMLNLCQEELRQSQSHKKAQTRCTYRVAGECIRIAFDMHLWHKPKSMCFYQISTDSVFTGLAFSYIFEKMIWNDLSKNSQAIQGSIQESLSSVVRINKTTNCFDELWNFDEKYKNAMTKHL